MWIDTGPGPRRRLVPASSTVPCTPVQVLKEDGGIAGVSGLKPRSKQL